MRYKQKELLATVLAALAVALFLARFLAISHHYPFYFIWDMDHIATLDTMLINSGKLPDHINHPCFGMYLVQSNTERVARALGLLSATRLQDLPGSLNPLAAVAELTQFLRLHAPFVDILLVLCLWAGLNLILRPGRWVSLLFLVTLGMQESLVYHASMIRTELYAMMFWSAALCLLGVALRARGARGLVAAVVGCGVLLGLCLLTKIQAFFHLAAFVPLALLAFTMNPPKNEALRQPLGRRAARALTVVALANLGVFLVLLFSAIMVKMPTTYLKSTFVVDANKILASEGVKSLADVDPARLTRYFEAGFKPNPLTFLFGLAFVGLAGYLGYLHKKDRTQSRGFLLAGGASLLLAGFLAAFLTHFLEFANPLKSLTYLLYDFKMIFYRDTSWQQNLPYIIIDPLGFIQYHPVMFAVHLGLLAILAAGYVRKFIAIRPLELALCAALTALALALLQLSVRYFTRDVLWEEVLINVLNCYYFTLIWRRARGVNVPRLRGAAVALLALMLVAETAHSLAMPRRLDMNCNRYGWQVDWMRNKVYEHNQLDYEKFMDAFYPRQNSEMWKAAKDTIYDYDWRRRTVEFIFQNQAVTQRQVGLVADGFPVWCARQDWRIAACTPEIKDAIVFDSSALPLRDLWFSKVKYVSEHSEYLDKAKPVPGKGLLSVLARIDMQTLLFVRDTPEALAAVQDTNFAPSPLRITLKKGNETMEMVGVAIRNYTEIPVDSLGQDYFFVLRRW